MAREIICGIYSISNTINKKIYIGSSINVYKRWSSHKYQLNKGIHHSNRLNDDWNEFGESVFVFEIMERCDKTDLIDREQFYIDKYKSCNPDFGYNVQPVAGRSMYLGATKDNIYNKKFNVSPEKYESLNYYLTTSDIPILEISKILDISSDTIYNIYYGRQYKNAFDSSTFIKRSAPSGAKHYKSFLSEEQVIDIVNMLKDGMTNIEIANIYCVNHHFIGDIRTHKSWKHLTEGIVFPKPKRKSLGMRKRIASYDKNGNLIKIYSCAEEAATDIGAKYTSNISSAARGRRNTAYGYIWKYVDQD